MNKSELVASIAEQADITKVQAERAWKCNLLVAFVVFISVNLLIFKRIKTTKLLNATTKLHFR